MKEQVANQSVVAFGSTLSVSARNDAQRQIEAEEAYAERISAATAARNTTLIEGLKEQRAEYLEQLRLRDRNAQIMATADQFRAMNDDLEMLRLESTLVRATNEEREIEVGLLRLRQQLIERGYTGKELEDEHKRLGAIVIAQAKITEETRKQTEAFEKNKQAAFASMDILRNGFEDLVLNGEKFNDVLKNMSKAFLQLGMDILVMEPLREMVVGLMRGGGGGGGAGSGAMIPGSYTPGAGTGIWGTLMQIGQTAVNMYSGWSAGTGASLMPNAATDAGALSAGALAENIRMYPLAHQGWHVGHEPPPAVRAAPASVFVGAPRLHRGGMRPGEFGAILEQGEEVLTAKDPRHRRNFRGGGGAPTIVMNISTPDANSFRQSQGQISANAGRAISIAQRRNG
jgi:hypothetical protein